MVSLVWAFLILWQLEELLMVKKPTYEELEQRVRDLEKEASERKESEEDRLAHITFLENIDRFDRAIRTTTDLEQMMGDVLETVLSIFRCDRAWLIFPCDPDSAFWSVPMERTVPEYPGAFALGKDIPTTPEMAAQFKAALELEEPLVFDPENDRPMPDSAQQFSTQSSIITAMHPKIGKPWVWGLSQCSCPRVWSVKEIELFKEVGRRISDALSSLLFLRDLRESERKSRAIFDQTFQFVGLMTVDGTLIEANRTALSFAGIKAKDVLGKPFWETTWWSHSVELQERLKEAVSKAAGGYSDRFEAFHPAADGNIHILDFSIRPVKDESGEVIFMIPEGHDITDYKRAEEALKESEDRYNALFTGITDAVLVHYISDDGLPGSFIEVNDIACRMLGYARDELMGMGVGDIDAPESTVDKRHIVEELKGGLDVLFEQTLVAKDGRRIPVEVHAQVFYFRGGPAVLSTVRDITERKRTHEVMIQTEKMMSVGGLAAGMAHEINNPLAGIMQNLQVLRNRMTDDTIKNRSIAEQCGTTYDALKAYMHQREILKMIESVMESGNRAARIVNNMLSFSRKSESGIEFHNLGELLDATVELAGNDYDLKKKYDFRQIEIVREYNADVHKVPCEWSKIQQVALNILSNGAQAMVEEENRTSDVRQQKAEGKRGKSAPRFTLRVMPDGEMVSIEIEDNGPGMDEITRKRVFEPFFTTKPVGTGTGLGLSVSYFIITENHRGTMEVKSAPGKGAKFIIRLPIKRT